MTRFHLAWLAASILISFGTNKVLAPRLDYEAAAAGANTLPSGELVASGIARGTLKLVDMRVVAADVEMTFGKPLPVRVLVIRGALEEEQTETDLELFVDLSSDGATIAPDARNLESIKGRALTVLPRAIASELRSRVRFPGTDGPAFVKSGTLMLSEALETVPGAFRVRGELDIEVERGDEELSLFARLSGKLVWP